MDATPTAIKPIETHYKGYRFRSRLEARWAVCFDTLGIKWEYENEGYKLPSGWYLPDFWIPSANLFIEIKGQINDEKYIKRGGVFANELAVASGRPVRLLFGDPARFVQVLFYPNGSRIFMDGDEPASDTCFETGSEFMLFVIAMISGGDTNSIRESQAAARSARFEQKGPRR